MEWKHGDEVASQLLVGLKREEHSVFQTAVARPPIPPPIPSEIHSSTATSSNDPFADAPDSASLMSIDNNSNPPVGQTTPLRHVISPWPIPSAVESMFMSTAASTLDSPSLRRSTASPSRMLNFPAYVSSNTMGLHDATLPNEISNLSPASIPSAVESMSVSTPSSLSSPMLSFLPTHVPSGTMGPHDTPKLLVATRDVATRDATRVLYERYNKKHQIQGLNFVAWSNGPHNALQWSAAFVCPISGDVFLPGNYIKDPPVAKIEVPLRRRDDQREEKGVAPPTIWFYGLKKMAIKAAAGRAEDCFRLRDYQTNPSVDGIAVFCLDRPYTARDALPPDVLGAIPHEPRIEIQTFQNEAVRRRQLRHPMRG